jgi:hypothetical protein
MHSGRFHLFFLVDRLALVVVCLPERLSGRLYGSDSTSQVSPPAGPKPIDVGRPENRVTGAVVSSSCGGCGRHLCGPTETCPRFELSAA